MGDQPVTVASSPSGVRPSWASASKKPAVGVGERRRGGGRVGRGRAQFGDLGVGERAGLADQALRAAEELVQQAVRGDADDARGARQFLQQQRIAVVAARRAADRGDLGAAGHQTHPGGVRAAGQRLGDGDGGVRRALDPHHPFGFAQRPGIGQAQHLERTGGAVPGVAPGDGLVGDAEHGGDPAERRPAVQLQRMHQLAVEGVEAGGGAGGGDGGGGGTGGAGGAVGGPVGGGSPVGRSVGLPVGFHHSRLARVGLRRRERGGWESRRLGPQGGVGNTGRRR